MRKLYPVWNFNSCVWIGLKRSSEKLALFQTTFSVKNILSPWSKDIRASAEPYSYNPETDPLLKIPPEPQEQSEVRPELVYYQPDHLGTPIAAHNAKGEAVWKAEYEAWGRIRQETVSDGLKVNVPFRFQGQRPLQNFFSSNSRNPNTGFRLLGGNEEEGYFAKVSGRISIPRWIRLW